MQHNDFSTVKDDTIYYLKYFYDYVPLLKSSKKNIWALLNGTLDRLHVFIYLFIEFLWLPIH